jgi:hypothetical protein
MGRSIAKKKFSKTAFLCLLLLTTVVPSFADAQSRARPAEGCAPNETGHSTAAGPVCTITGSTDDEGANVIEEAGEAIVAGTTHAGLVFILSPVAAVSFVILSLSSLLLYLSGILFNWSLAYLVFNFGVYFGNSSGLLLAWGILRDFGNIVLLFGFVFMGIQTILNINHFDVGKTLSRLVIFAVLLNFSLFISEAIIDATNGLTAALYSQTSDCVTSDVSCLVNHGIAAEILDRAGLMSALGYGAQQIEASGGEEGNSNYFTNPIGETLKFLGLSILITTAFVVLIAGAFLLLSRAVHLTFLMVVSPIGFAGMAVPWLEKMAKDWWDSLIKQAMFAPVFLLLLFVSLKLLDGLDGLANVEGGIASAIQSPNAVDTGPLLFFALIIGFMIGSMLVAKKFGIYGADMITKTALGVIKGSAAYPFTPYRDMAGAGAKNLGKRYNILAGDIAKQYGKTKVPIWMGGGLTKAVIGAAGSAVDSGIAGGFKGAQNIKVGGKSYSDRNKELEERDKTREKDRREDENAKNLKGALATATGPNPNSDDLERRLQEMSVAELEQTKYIKEGAEGIKTLAEHLSPEKFASLMDSKEVSDETKEMLMDGRFTRLMDAVNRQDHDAVRKWSTEDLTQLAKRDTTRFASLVSGQRTNGDDLISEEQYDSLAKNKSLTNSQRDFVKRNSILGRVEGAATGGNNALAESLALNLKSDRKAKLSKATLMNAGVAATYNDRDLQKIAAADKLETLAERATVKALASVAGHRNEAANLRHLTSQNGIRYWGP